MNHAEPCIFIRQNHWSEIVAQTYILNSNASIEPQYQSVILSLRLYYKVLLLNLLSSSYARRLSRRFQWLQH